MPNLSEHDRSPQAFREAPRAAGGVAFDGGFGARRVRAHGVVTERQAEIAEAARR
jgi:hypothetical protein